MKSWSQLLWTFLCVMFLSACGGGGGSPGKTPNGAALFTSAGTSLQILPGQSQTFTVGGGTPPYLVSTSSGALSATIVGTVLTVTGSSGGGAGSVIVSDNAGAKVKIDVTVGTGITLFTSAPSQISVPAGSIIPDTAPYFTIGGGSGVYSVSSSNNAVAYAAMNGNYFLIGGVAAGTATVSVTDSGGALVTINVTVTAGSSSLGTTMPGTVNLPIAQAVTYTVSGGTPPYSVLSDSIGIATVVQNGNLFTVTGIGAGTANIYIYDALNRATPIKNAVTVTPAAVSKLTVVPGNSTGNVGETLNFAVTGGVPPYSVLNSNNSIATLSVASGGATFSGLLNNIGMTQVSVTDSAGTSQVINVTVAQNGPNLRLSPSAFSISGLYNGAVTLYVYGGTPPYTAYTSDLNMGTVTVSTLSATNPTTGLFTVSAVGNKIRNGNTISARCFTNTAGTYLVTLTVVDSKGVIGSSIMTVQSSPVDSTCVN